jgi:hypothetical protein
LQAVPDPDLVVTGLLDPDATGNYYAYGEYGGQTSYANEAETFFIWHDEIGLWWEITEAIGVPGTAGWRRVVPSVAGDYWPTGAATEVATVIEP